MNNHAVNSFDDSIRREKMRSSLEGAAVYKMNPANIHFQGETSMDNQNHHEQHKHMTGEPSVLDMAGARIHEENIEMPAQKSRISPKPAESKITTSSSKAKHLIILAIIVAFCVSAFFYDRINQEKSFKITNANSRIEEENSKNQISSDKKLHQKSVENVTVDSHDANEIVSVADGAAQSDTNSYSNENAEMAKAQELLSHYQSGENSKNNIEKTEEKGNIQPQTDSSTSSIRIDNIESLARGAADSAHELAPKVASIEDKLASQQEQINSTQKAASQAAQAVMSVQAQLKAVTPEISAMKGQITQINERIDSLEKRVGSLQQARPSKSLETDAPLSDKKSANINNGSNKPDSQASIANQTQTAAEVKNTDVKKAPYVITKLRVLVTNDKAAIIADEEGKQYVIEGGQKYKNLGLVKLIDNYNKKVFGVFDDGVEWAIQSGKI